MHAPKGGNCKLAGTLPRSESSCHFVFGRLRSVTSSPVRQCTRSRCRRPWMHGGVGYLDTASIAAESIVALARLAESISKDVITLKFLKESPMRLRARRERMPSGRAARPRPRALLGFYGGRGFRLVASTSARLADIASHGARIEPRVVLNAKFFIRLRREDARFSAGS